MVLRVNFGTVTNLAVLEPHENLALLQKSTFAAVLLKYFKTFEEIITWVGKPRLSYMSCSHCQYLFAAMRMAKVEVDFSGQSPRRD